MLQRRFFLCLLACFLHCPLYSRSEDVGFPLTDYSVLHPSTLSQGDVVFRETLNFNGFCNVNFAVELSGEGREIFETERNGLEIIVTLVNTSALEETDYQLNITVNGTYTACTSMGSTSSTAATSATSDAIEPTPSLSSFTTQMMSSQSAANVMESQNVSSSESTTSVTPSLQTTPTGSSSESTTSVTPSLQTTPTGSSSESTTSVTPSLQTTPTGSSSDSTTSVTPSPTGSDIEVTMTETMSSSSPSPASPTMFSSSAGLLVRIVPPVTIAATTPTTLFPTEVASFNCSYWNSSALVDFEWYVDDVQDNETGPTFSFQVKLSNNGSLVRCQVGNDSSPSISLQITNPMVTLSTQPDANNSVSLQGTTYDSVFAANGDTVDVTCSLNSGPVFELLVVTSSYMVQENGSLLNGEESTLSSNGTGRVNVSESTSVFCRALVDGEVFESRTIIIAVVPYNLTIEASPGVQVEYTAGLNLTCNAMGGPTLNFSWVLPNGMEEDGSVLLVDMVTEMEDGEYVCTVTSEAGNTSVSISVQVGLALMMEPSPLLVDSGDMVNFTCEASGSDPITYQWLKDGTVLPESSRVSGTNSTTLAISPVESQDFGNYSCNVSNPVNSLLSRTALLTVSPRNLVTITPMMILTNQSDDEIFTCESGGGPGNSFQWYLNGELLLNETSSNISITMVTASDAGEYNCTVTNAAGGGSDVATLIVGLQLMMEPSSLLVNSGDVVNFTCEASGSDPITYQWLKDGTVLPESSRVSGTNSTTLTIIPVESQDFGNYSCNVSNPVNSLLSTTALLTVSPRNLVNVTSTMILTNQSDDEIFTCESGGGPGNSFQWYLNGELLLNETSSVINITMVTASDAGEYNCTVTNAAGGGSDVAMLIVGVVIDSPPSDVLTNTSTSVTFTCGVSGSEPIDYTWFLGNGTQVESTNRITGTNTSMLTIDDVVSSDYGEYFCSASNAVNRQRSENALLTVSPLGSVVVQQVNFTVNETDNVTFMCSGEGGPGNRFAWLFNGTSLSNATVLAVRNISAEDGGDYICEVSNAAGSGRQTGRIFVNPVLVTDPVGANVPILTSYSLLCEARGFPPPTIIWFQNNTNISQNEARTITTTITGVVVRSQLTLLNATFDDSGAYQCVALANHPGGFLVGSDTVNITVQSIPERPVNVTVADVAPRSVLLKWIEPHDNNAEITDYEVEVQDDTDSNSPPVTQRTMGAVEMLNVTGLKPFNNYTFVVFANNSLGRSPPSAPVTTQTDESIPTAPLNLTSVNVGSLSISISWERPSSPNGVLLSYLVTYVRTDNNTVFTLTTPPTVRAANLTLLTAFVTYNITVRANTSVGFGPDSAPLIVLTQPAVPSEIRDITIMNTSSTSVRVTFNVPSPPNGIILAYEVNITRASTPRSRRAAVEDITVDEQMLLRNVSNDTREINIGGFEKFSENTICLRAFSQVGGGVVTCMTFVTSEDVPLPPMNVEVFNVSSKSLNVTWDKPMFVHGILLAYEIAYVSSDGSSNAINKTDGFESSNSMVLDGLTINTQYNISVRAYTSAGPGVSDSALGMTNEDAPPRIASFNVTQPTTGSGELVLTWTPPTTRNGDYTYLLSYSFKSAFTHTERIENGNETIPLDRTMMNGADIASFIIMNTSDTERRVRSFADYTFSISGCNILFGNCNAPSMETIRTEVTRATPVTNLIAVPLTSGSDNPPSFDIKVTWDLPLFPNGEITNYEIHYFPSLSPGDRKSTMVDVSQTTFFINTSTPHTNYTIEVIPVSRNANGFSHTVIQRTNQSAPLPSDIGNPSEMGISYTSITVVVPVPSEDTGVIRVFDVLVVGPNAGDLDTSLYLERSGLERVRRALTIDNPDGIPGLVPPRVREANPLEVGGLEPNSRYLIFTRTEYFMDGTTLNVVFSSPFAVTTLNSGLTAGLVIFFFLLVLIIVGLVVVIVFLLLRRRRKSYDPGLADIPLSPTDADKPNVYVNLSIPQWTATMDPVSIQEFPDHVRQLHADDDYRFSEEYKNVEPDHSPTVEAFSNSANATKNRYGNITSYDHSRVRLKPVEGVAGSDYINANFIDGYRMPSAFIATQGPVPDSIKDFWRMVWEQNSPTIIMLTNLEERGRVKCHKYWPAKTDSYGDIRVSQQDEVVLTEYTVRTFSVIKSGFREERIITQYHYTSWPDFGVPSYPTPLLTFVRRVSANHPADKGPMVVHCSAGVGRSGTFITVLSQLKRMAAESNLDIYGFVRAMRHRRCLMVQTEAQYIFLHDALLEAIECGITEVQARDLPSHYKKLQATDEATGKTLLEMELQRLNTSIHKKPAQSEGIKPTNRGKNRFADILPYDTTRCRLSSVIGVSGSDYINANFINGYTTKNAFIATQGPLPDTTGDFWRMVWENKCHTVIMLTKEKEGGRVRCHKYWPDGNDMYGQIQVVHISETPYSEFILREFKLIDTKDKSSLPLKHFQFLGWPEESGKVPEHGADVIDLIGQVQKWQRTAGTAPVVVHCSGGSGRTGTFITIANLLDCLKSEGVVDVFQTVRTLRLQRPNMVRTVEQYRYCYTTVLEYLESFDLYANFK